MKRIPMAAGLLLAAATASAQFEGVADFKVTMHTGAGKSMDSSGKMYVTRNAYRMEWETDLGTVFRGKDGARAPIPKHVKMTMFTKAAEPDRVYMVNDEGRTYSTFDAQKAKADAPKRPKDTYTVQKLGTDSVAGLSCQKALLTSSTGSAIEVCMTKDFAASSDWLAAMSRRQGDSTSWIGALKEHGLEGFPIRYAIRPQGSKDASVTMELTHLEKKSLPGSLFEVPAGYKQTDFAMGGMTPEQEKAMADIRAKMREKMTPEQRKAHDEAMQPHTAPTPKP